jgi:hypothetical protein
MRGPVGTSESRNVCSEKKFEGCKYNADLFYERQSLAQCIAYCPLRLVHLGVRAIIISSIEIRKNFNNICDVDLTAIARFI